MNISSIKQNYKKREKWFRRLKIRIEFWGNCNKLKYDFFFDEDFDVEFARLEIILKLWIIHESPSEHLMET